MGSPVTNDSVPVITDSMESCDAFKAILQSVRELKSLANWLFDEDGLPNISVAREFGALILPPGATLDLVFSQGTSQAVARSTVEKMWLTVDEQTAYNNARESIQPFWVVADEEQRNGAPNLAGRFKVNGDYRLLSAGNVSGKIGIEAPGGSKDHVLSVSELPAHKHELTVPSALGPAPDLRSVGLVYVPASKGGQGAGGSASDLSLYHQIDLANSTGDSAAHNNMPPYSIVIVAYRTSRLS